MAEPNKVDMLELRVKALEDIIKNKTFLQDDFNAKQIITRPLQLKGKVTDANGVTIAN